MTPLAPSTMLDFCRNDALNFLMKRGTARRLSANTPTMDIVLHPYSLRHYRPDIDGLRAIAVIGVVLFHAGVPIVSGGFTGVDIFFVISGYLIGGHILSEHAYGTFSFLHFYRRRAKRILPAFFVVLLFTLICAIILLSPFELYIFAKSAIASLLSISNVYFGVNAIYFHTSNQLKPLLMTWSLSIEEQFYAVIPLLIILTARIRRNLLMPMLLTICALSFVFACIELTNTPRVAFYSLPARAWELCVGVILALAEMNRESTRTPPAWSHISGFAGLSLMLAPMYFLSSATPFPGGYAIPSVFGTALLIHSSSSWINRNLLSFPPLVFIGCVSYSWYLWHWPILAFLRLASTSATPLTVIAIAVITSFTIAVVSYYLVEQPFRRSTIAPVTLLIRYAIVTSLFLAACITLRVSHGFPTRNPALLHDGELSAGSCVADYGSDTPDLSSRCYPISDPRPSVALWGDSHSAVLAQTLRNIAGGEGYNFIQLSKSSCLPLTGAALFLADRPMVAEECLHFNKQVLALISKDSRIRLVIVTGRWAAPFYQHNADPLISQVLYPDRSVSTDDVKGTFTRSLSDSILPILNDGKHVIVLDDVPAFDFDPLLKYRTAHMPARRALSAWMRSDNYDTGFAPSTSGSAAQTASELLRQTLKHLRGVEIVELRPLFCNSRNLCAYMDGELLLYADEHHLTEEGAHYALQHFHFPTL